MENDVDIELLEMLGAGFADRQPLESAAPPVIADAVEEEPEQEPFVPPAQTPLADELPALLKVLRGLPPEQRAEVLELATVLGISPGADDLLYSLLVGLGYHKTMLAAVPDQIAQAGEQAKGAFLNAADNAKTEIAVKLLEGAGSVIQAGEQANIRLQKTLNACAAQIQIAAGKGAQNAVSNMDISPIVENAISKIASKTEIALAKKWFSRAVIVASVCAVLIAGVAGFAGFKIAALLNNSGNQNSPAGDFYLNQLNCSAAMNGVIPCRDQFGNVIKFRSK